MIFPDEETNDIGYNPKKPMSDLERNAKNLQRTLGLFTVSNPKTLKGQKKKFFTGVLMLSPASISGHNVCAFSTPGCRAACLNTAGRGGMVAGGAETSAEVIERSNVIQRARLRRTQFLFEKTPKGSTPTPIVSNAFGFQFIKEIKQIILFAKDNGMKPAIRLNGTSDLLWESMPVHARKNIMWHFKDVQFYDYTKWPVHYRLRLPDNYYILYSWNEGKDASEYATGWLKRGHNIAAVFSTKKNHPLPAKFLGYKVIDADLTDVRFKDPKGVVAGLRAKGFAKRDTSGFVIQVDQMNPGIGNDENDDLEGGDLFPDFN